MRGDENEGLAAPWYGRGESFYCRYEGENSQRYQEESRLNIASRIDQGSERRSGEREGRGERANR